MGKIIGLSQIDTNAPGLTPETFKTFIPALADYIETGSNMEAFKLYRDICKNSLQYAYWSDMYLYAMSLAVAHYLTISNPDSAHRVSADATAGGVMSNRSVGNINYTYDTNKTMKENNAYMFWNRTGYGQTLVALSLSRGFVPFIVVQPGDNA